MMTHFFYISIYMYQGVKELLNVSFGSLNFEITEKLKKCDINNLNTRKSLETTNAPKMAIVYKMQNL